MPQISETEKAWVKLLDTQFKIPGTNIKFGLDAILGLVPGFGDATSFLIQLALLLGIVRKGISGELIMRMLLNLLADAIFGAIPVLGTFWDVWFKSSQRNMNLALGYWQENKYQGTGKSQALGLLLVTLGLLGGIIYLLVLLFSYIFSLFSGG